MEPVKIPGPPWNPDDDVPTFYAKMRRREEEKDEAWRRFWEKEIKYQEDCLAFWALWDVNRYRSVMLESRNIKRKIMRIIFYLLCEVLLVEFCYHDFAGEPGEFLSYGRNLMTFALCVVTGLWLIVTHGRI